MTLKNSNRPDVRRLGIEILEEWAGKIGYKVSDARRRRVAITGNKSGLASVTTAYQGRGLYVPRPAKGTGAHIQVRVGKERGGSWDETEIVVLDAARAWELPADCKRAFNPEEHTRYNFCALTAELDYQLKDCGARTPLELAKLLAICL